MLTYLIFFLTHCGRMLNIPQLVNGRATAAQSSGFRVHALNLSTTLSQKNQDHVV